MGSYYSVMGFFFKVPVKKNEVLLEACDDKNYLQLD